MSKPIVAQIYRTWSDASGQKWVNACWYYRPEQTVHRFDKHFYESEVVKTGQYRDHRIDDVEDRCFVMFITRFPRGRPRGLPADKSVYVCEARYNEEKFKFNKIKTWTSCLPDEVRDKDYEMDLFDGPRNLKKIPSPIKHLLQADAKESDDLPKPTWRSLNAPPLIGAVHRRPRESNVSVNPYCFALFSLCFCPIPRHACFPALFSCTTGVLAQPRREIARGGRTGSCYLLAPVASFFIFPPLPSFSFPLPSIPAIVVCAT